MTKQTYTKLFDKTKIFFTSKSQEVRGAYCFYIFKINYRLSDFVSNFEKITSPESCNSKIVAKTSPSEGLLKKGIYLEVATSTWPVKS